jgi:hypothetical protein
MKKISLKTLLVTITIVGASIFLTGCQKATQSPFIVTNDAKDITNPSETQSMYKTDLSLDEVLSFYREKLTANNLVERELLTIQSDTTLNLVFDGSENGKALVIQAVVIDDYTNVVIRFEKI